MRGALAGFIGIAACVAAPGAARSAEPAPRSAEPPRGALADVLEVDPRGSSGSYLFLVTVRSPDTGCEQYADWWEVITPAGQLVYRRLLEHSHVNEQPFARSGGPVRVEEDQEVIVRAHMNRAGYGGVALRGTPLAGFERTPLAPDFAAGVASQEPLPQGCTF
jgi:hypothetical protein